MGRLDSTQSWLTEAESRAAVAVGRERSQQLAFGEAKATTRKERQRVYGQLAALQVSPWLGGAPPYSRRQHMELAFLAGQSVRFQVGSDMLAQIFTQALFEIMEQHGSSAGGKSLAACLLLPQHVRTDQVHTRAHACTPVCGLR